MAVEVRQFARRLNGEPPEDSVIEEEPRPGYYSASRATRCVKCRWDTHRCLDCSGDLRARLELQDKLKDGYQEPARGDPGEWCRVLQPAKIRGGFAASSKAVGFMDFCIHLPTKTDHGCSDFMEAYTKHAPCRRNAL